MINMFNIGTQASAYGKYDSKGFGRFEDTTDKASKSGDVSGDSKGWAEMLDDNLFGDWTPYSYGESKAEEVSK